MIQLPLAATLRYSYMTASAACALRLSVRTTDSHSVKRGSTPLGRTNQTGLDVFHNCLEKSASTRRFFSIFRLREQKVLTIRAPQHAPFVYRLGRQIFIL